MTTIPKRQFLLVTILLSLGVGYWFSSIISSSGQVDMQHQYVRPKEISTPEYSAFSVDDAKAFDKFPLYWLGDSFQGLPLETIIRKYFPNDKFPQDAVVFIYGTCTPSAEAGCSPPLQVRIEPYCYRQPDFLADEAKQGPEFTVRGAKAQRISDGLRIWTGIVSIRIAADSDALETAAADSLVPAEGQTSVVPVDGQTSVAGGGSLPPVDTDCSQYQMERLPAS